MRGAEWVPRAVEDGGRLCLDMGVLVQVQKHPKTDGDGCISL